jgi:2-iminobutanoate/2-iminopropanoate deaminase
MALGEGATLPRLLTCMLSVPKRLKVGEPVELLFRLGNPTSQSLSVLSWHTPLEGLLNDIFRVTRDGAEVPYRGEMMKRGAPDASAYVTVAPGTSVEARVNLSEAYDFRQPGKYRLEFRGPLKDVAPRQAEVPRPPGQLQPLEVECPAVETVIGTAPPGPRPPDGGYVHAYEVVGPARVLYLSGQIPVRPDGTVPETFDAQCRQVWANIEGVLAEAGMGLEQLVKVTTFLSDRRYRDENSAIRRELLGDHRPALTVLITGIYDPAWLLEIEAVASAPL